MMHDRDYVRARVKSGAATKWEKHWLWCMDHGGWRPFHRGPYAAEFSGEHYMPIEIQEAEHVEVVDVVVPAAAQVPDIADDDGIY